ncbi:MAG: EAL domain-containing protein [Clostridiales bacterium]|nr:EAL domain-containing protein [Clostridiales bacterium]
MKQNKLLFYAALGKCLAGGKKSDRSGLEKSQAVKFNIVPEYISCVLMALIGVYMLFDKKTPSIKETTFRISLMFAIIATVNNIVSIYAIENAARMPVLFNVFVNTFYFFSVAVMTTMVSITTYVSMFEGRYEARRFRLAVIVSLSYFLLEVALVLSNLPTGWLFHFDASGAYHRGPLNGVGLLFLVISIANVLWFGMLEWRNIKKGFRLVFFTLPAIGIVLGTIQFFFTDTIFTGTIIAFAILTLFISGQQQRARVDALTELPSREAFFNDIDRLCQRNQAYRIIIIGLRNFKQVNSQLGQRAGDALLVEIVSFLSHLDGRAAAYRTSGVQFMLVVTKMTQDEYEALFSAVMRRFTQRWETQAGAIELHALFADIQFPDHAADVDEIIASLEYATRIAKQDITGKPARFSECMRSEFMRRNYVISQMEKALREGLFFLNIQPVFDIAHGRFSGGEVLLRLNEDNGMPISPGEFIPIAIDNGIATKLGLMVMEKTCQFLQQNRDENIGWLSINVSSQQDEFDETARHLEMLLDQYGVEPGRIKLEITEMVLLEDLERAHTTMDELGKRGIGVYLDDFGTGYSNLVNVMTLPFECVKIDKGFIRNIANNPKSCGMLQTVVSGLRSLNVVTLAEGVETKEQDDIVRALGIDRIQGYFYARPMSTEEYVWMIHHHCAIEPIPPAEQT